MLAAYYGGMLYLYLFTMPEEEAVRLAGFSRYACSGMALFCGNACCCGLVKDVENSFAVDIDERGAYRAYSSPGAKRRYQNAVLVTFLLGVNFFYFRMQRTRSDPGTDMWKLCPGECRLWQEMRGRPGGKKTRSGTWSWRQMRRGRCPGGKCDTFSGIFCGAEDVEVRDIREPEAWEAEIREGII